MWFWKLFSWECDASPLATILIRAFSSGSVAARSASIWMTGSVPLPAGGGGACDCVVVRGGGTPFVLGDGARPELPVWVSSLFGTCVVFCGVAVGLCTI